MESKKYKILEISHPEYPWLHRIQALRKINDHVDEGEIGGFVQSEWNLSHEGTSWIYDQAICCEEAIVEKEAELHDGAIAKGSALVSGDSNLFDRAVAEGNSCIFSGEVKDVARIAGNAIIDRAGEGMSPLIGENSNVYGIVKGWFIIKDNIFEGEKLINHTGDMFIVENGKRTVLIKNRILKPPDKQKKLKKPREVER